MQCKVLCNGNNYDVVKYDVVLINKNYQCNLDQLLLVFCFKTY
jgi:hypothetical protein